MTLKLEVRKGLFLSGIIAKDGLRKHLEERVFIGRNEDEITTLMFYHKGPGRQGILRLLDENFYVQICRIDSTRKDFKWNETGQRYIIKEGDVIRIWEKYKDHGRDYEVRLK